MDNIYNLRLRKYAATFEHLKIDLTGLSPWVLDEIESNGFSYIDIFGGEIIYNQDKFLQEEAETILLEKILEKNLEAKQKNAEEYNFISDLFFESASKRKRKLL